MPNYIYKGVTSGNKQVKGEIKATSKNEAISLLRKKKIRTISLSKKPAEINLGFGGTVKLVDVSRFTRQFAAMTSAGLPLVQCMDILGNQTENKLLATAIKKVSTDIQGGNSLAEALAKHGKIFNSLYCNMVAAGETSGNLDGVLVRLAEYQEKAYALVRKVKGAMTYPVVLLTIASGATALLLTFVVPKFAEMFVDMGGTLPLPTQIVMAISDFLQKYIFLIIVGIIGGVIALMRYHNTEKGAFVIDTIILKIPVLGDLQRKTAISRFSQTLSTLLNSGIGILDALSITAKTSGNKVLERGIFQTVEKITGGQSISSPLSETGLFPPMVIHMISVGEKTGDITTMLGKIATFYEEEVDAAVDALTSVLEPIMIVVMGILIGGILIAMYLPMFDMINLVG